MSVICSKKCNGFTNGKYSLFGNWGTAAKSGLFWCFLTYCRKALKPETSVFFLLAVWASHCSCSYTTTHLFRLSWCSIKSCVCSRREKGPEMKVRGMGCLFSLLLKWAGRFQEGSLVLSVLSGIVFSWLVLNTRPFLMRSAAGDNTEFNGDFFAKRRPGIGSPSAGEHSI